jgi:hypothetical protein
MTPPLRFSGLLLVVAAACGATAYTLTPGGGELYECETERRREAELAEQGAILRARMFTKTQLCDDFIGGRRRVAELTDLFMTLNRQPPEVVSLTRTSFRGESEWECTLRQVASHLRGRVADRTDLSADERRRVLDAVEEEMQELLQSPPVGGS